MFRKCLVILSLCLPAAHAWAANVSLNGSGGDRAVSLSWTVTNGAINAQEVYRDTDSNPSGRVRIASISASARTYTDATVEPGRTYWYWIKARQTSSNTTVDSNSVAVAPITGPSFRELTGNLGTHDPTIAEESGIWYEFQTGPGIYRKISRNGGYHWEPLPAVLSRGLPWWRTYVPNHDGIDVWAPDVKDFRGRVWMYYSISTFGSRTSLIGLLSADSLAADRWRDDGLVIRTTDANNYNAIDPDLVIDASGNPWLSFGSFNSGIKLTKLDSTTMKPTGTLYSIASREGGIEAPVIVLRNGYYYLFVSVGFCCRGVNSTYQIRYGRSTSITGPYLDKAGIDMLRGGGSLLDAGNQRWIGPGGQDIQNTTVIARHAYDATDNGNAKLLINTLNWDAQGWPVY